MLIIYTTSTFDFGSNSQFFAELPQLRPSL